MSNTATSDFNLTRLSTKELEENLKATIEFGGNVFIASRRGTGKTVISKQTIKDCNHKEVYINLSTADRPDLGGYPNFFAAQAGQNFVNFILPDFYRPLIEGDQPVVALLDEVDKADSSLWAPLLEFTQFHTINGRQLPNLKAVIMTGNLISEGSVRPSLPLLDRAEKYLVEASHTHWLDWAAKSGEIHASVSAYIADHPEDLFGDVDPGDVYADPSPRGWHNASKIVIFGEEKRWPNKVLVNKVAGCIGKKAGIKYSAYFEHYQVLLPIIEKIMNGEEVKNFDNLEQSKQMVACMIVCSRLARLLDDMKASSKKELPTQSDAVAKFLGSVDPEMSLISIRSQIGLDRFLTSGLDENPSFDKILTGIVGNLKGS